MSSEQGSLQPEQSLSPEPSSATEPLHIFTLLEKVAHTLSDRVAAKDHVVSSGSNSSNGFTYSCLLQDARRLAARIKASQAKYLVLCDEPSSSLLTALFAAAYARVPYVPLNYRLTDTELRSLAAQTTPSLAITGTTTRHRLTGIEQLKTLSIETLRSKTQHFNSDTEHARTNMEHPHIETDDTEPDDTAVLIYTSGTTGKPKSAVLRHRHLTSYVTSMIDFASAGADETHIMAVPPYHIASVASLLSNVYAGRRIVPLACFNAKNWVELAREENATHVLLVPTMLTRIVDYLELVDEKLPFIRSVAYGGGRTHLSTVERATRLMPEADFFHAYGMTEACSTISMLSPEDHRVAFFNVQSDSSSHSALQRLSSVGKPLPSIEVSVRRSDGTEIANSHGFTHTATDTDNTHNATVTDTHIANTASVTDTHTATNTDIDNTTQTGAGEIWLRGTQVSGEYRETGSTLDAEGWFRTHDIGRFDSYGYLYLLGRSDDLIVRGGENISPHKIEQVLISHSEVQDVAAFGVNSVEWGQEIAVAVVTNMQSPTEGDLLKLVDDLKQLAATHLRSSRTPTHFEFLEQLPYNTAGKLLRRSLTDHFNSARGNGYTSQ